jgi:hypothetical protein
LGSPTLIWFLARGGFNSLGAGAHLMEEVVLWAGLPVPWFAGLLFRHRSLRMSRNIGGDERTLRSAIGAALAAFALLADLQFGWAVLLFLAGIVLLLTALVRYCPLNAALGRDSTGDASMLR